MVNIANHKIGTINHISVANLNSGFGRDEESLLISLWFNKDTDAVRAVQEPDGQVLVLVREQDFRDCSAFRLRDAENKISEISADADVK